MAGGSEASGMRRPRSPRRLPAALCAMAFMPALHAMSLSEALQAARDHDPQYRAALHELEATRQGVPIARSVLFPQVSLSYSNANVSGTREFPNSLSQQVTTRVDYESPQTALNLRMPLFNYEAWSRVDQATAQARGAEASFRARGLELAERVATAYLQTLEAHAQLTLADAEVVALQSQFQRAEQRLRRGEGTKTDEALALAGVEVARARASDARERVLVAAARLRRLTGQAPAFVQNIVPDFRPLVSAPAVLREWTDAALTQSPVVEARAIAVDAARFGVRRAQAGHLPRVDLIGSVARNRNESLANLDQTSNLRTIGVQVSVPLFSGGGVQASVRQAQSEMSRAEEDLRNERENVQLEVRRLLQAADSAALRADALRNAVAAGETAVTGATRAQAAGLATQSEVLDARSRLYASRRELAQAQYDHLAARMRMMLLAGEAMQRVIEQIGAVLIERIDLTPSASLSP